MSVYISASSPTPGQQIGTTAAFDATMTAWTDTPGVFMNGMQLNVFDTNKSGAIVYNSGYLTGTQVTRTFTIPANTLTAGKTYVFQFYGKDGAGVFALLDVTVSAVGATATPTITVPTAGAVISSPTNTVTWTLANGNTQYQVQVLNGSTVVFDTGVTDSTAQTVTGVPFPDTGVSRTVQVRAKRGASYAWSAWASVNVTVSHTAPMTPAITALTATDVAGIGFTHALVATITQPTPSGGAPTVTSTEVYVRPTGDSSAGVLVDAVANAATSYTFKSPTSGITYQVRVRVVSADGRNAYSAWVTANAAVVLKGVVLYSLAAPTVVKVFRFNGDEASDDYQPTAELIQYDGRPFPVVEFGVASTRALEVTLDMKTDADAAALRTMLLSRSIVLYRDRRGRKVYAFVSASALVDTAYGYRTNLTITAVDYPADRSV